MGSTESTYRGEKSVGRSERGQGGLNVRDHSISEGHPAAFGGFIYTRFLRFGTLPFASFHKSVV